MRAVAYLLPVHKTLNCPCNSERRIYGARVQRAVVEAFFTHGKVLCSISELQRRNTALGFHASAGSTHLTGGKWVHCSSCKTLSMATRGRRTTLLKLFPTRD
eukprot:1847369-Amphidinium_carterae.2